MSDWGTTDIAALREGRQPRLNTSLREYGMPPIETPAETTTFTPPRLRIEVYCANPSPDGPGIITEVFEEDDYTIRFSSTSNGYRLIDGALEVVMDDERRVYAPGQWRYVSQVLVP